MRWFIVSAAAVCFWTLAGDRAAGDQPPVDPVIARARQHVGLELIPPVRVVGEGDLAPQLQRLRGTSDRVRYAIDVAYRVSPTFRGLVDTIESSSVVVYVKDAVCSKGQPSACTLLASTSETVRYLHVHVNTKQAVRDLAMMLAHELQHVIEIAQEPSVVDQTSLAALLRRIGLPSTPEPGVYETRAALSVAAKVRRELMDAGY